MPLYAIIESSRNVPSDPENKWGCPLFADLPKKGRLRLHINTYIISPEDSCVHPTTSGMHTRGKYEFWEHMDAEMQAVPRSERLVLAGDLNGHVGRDRDGYDGVPEDMDWV